MHVHTPNSEKIIDVTEKEIIRKGSDTGKKTSK